MVNWGTHKIKLIKEIDRGGLKPYQVNQIKRLINNHVLTIEQIALQYNTTPKIILNIKDEIYRSRANKRMHEIRHEKD